MSNELSGYSIKQPLQSAPMTGEVMSVDAENRVCTVQVQSQVVDNVTWHGIEPVTGEIVYLTDAGDRLIAVVPRPDDSDVFVNINGDTMTGSLVLPGTPGKDNVAATRQIVFDTADAIYAKRVNSGNGLTGGGKIGDQPTLSVNRGRHILIPTVTGDAASNAYNIGCVRLAPGCEGISDWNTAIDNGSYMASGAANGPSSTMTGWWYGWTIRHNDIWCTQFAVPFAQNGIDGRALMVRHLQNGAWTTWARVSAYVTSWSSNDCFQYFIHGGNSGANVGGTSRWAIGNKKGASTTDPSTDDQFRIQRYDTGGTYAGNVMTASTAGVVNFPAGHTLLAEAMEAQAEVEADRAATVGIVAGMILSALENYGLITPAQRLEAHAVFGLTVGDPTPDYDPTSAEEAQP